MTNKFAPPETYENSPFFSSCCTYIINIIKKYRGVKSEYGFEDKDGHDSLNRLIVFYVAMRIKPVLLAAFFSSGGNNILIYSEKKVMFSCCFCETM